MYYYFFQHKETLFQTRVEFFSFFVDCTSILVNALSGHKNKDILFEEAYCLFGYTHKTIQEVNSISWTLDQWSPFCFNTTLKNYSIIISQK